MDLWNTETPINEIEGLDIDVPAWISQDISPSDVAAILQGGCASGAYMPAVTYHEAAKTMSEHGDDVLQYLQDNMDGLPKPPDDVSWSGLACFYLSAAVEYWVCTVEDQLQSFDRDDV
jgi:hypothetical protein